MKDRIDKLFEQLEKKLHQYMESNSKVVFESANNELQRQLKEQKQECEESQKTLVEVAQKIHNTMLIMKSVLNDADQRD